MFNEFEYHFLLLFEKFVLCKLFCIVSINDILKPLQRKVHYILEALHNTMSPPAKLLWPLVYIPVETYFCENRIFKFV